MKHLAQMPLYSLSESLMDLQEKHGFTLIELLIVIAIVGILAAVALAYYRSQYIARARLSEVTNSMSVVASSVASYYEANNSFPSASDVEAIASSLGVLLPSGGTGRISGMEVNEGVITATITNIDPVMEGRTLVLTPTTDQHGSISWSWSGSVPSVYIPKR